MTTWCAANELLVGSSIMLGELLELYSRIPNQPKLDGQSQLDCLAVLVAEAPDPDSQLENGPPAVATHLGCCRGSISQ